MRLLAAGNLPMRQSDTMRQRMQKTELI